MRRRHPLPRLWLMTDERIGEALWEALERLPRGAGVVFRHYATPADERRRMLAKIARIARRRGLALVAAGEGAAAHGSHGRRPRRTGALHTRSAHTRREALAAQRAGADAIFVSPVYPTRSHPGARPLGRIGLRLMIRGLQVPVIALGGMTAHRARSLPIYGWAAIDAWTRDQKRKAVPR